MIIVVGSPGFRAASENASSAAVGVAADIAREAVSSGSTVELVGKIGDDAAGDALVLALAAARIGHAALLRDAAHGTPLAGEDGTGDDDDPDLVAEERAPGGDGLVPEDPAERPAVDAGDLSLAFRYLSDYQVIVVADPIDGASAEVVAEAAAFAGAQVVVVGHESTQVAEALASATVLEAPPLDPDRVFAAVVGRYAAELDRGVLPADAFKSAVSGAGWQPVEG